MTLSFTRHKEKGYLDDILFNSLNNLYQIVTKRNPGTDHENWNSLGFWDRVFLLKTAMED